jgi:hypothetical protein
MFKLFTVEGQIDFVIGGLTRTMKRLQDLHDRAYAKVTENDSKIEVLEHENTVLEAQGLRAMRIKARLADLVS